MATLIPQGYYTAVATKVETENGPSFVQFGYTSTDKKQVAIAFEITEGEFKGRRLTWFGFFTEKTYERTLESLRYCGFKGDDLSAAQHQDLDQEVSLAIEHEASQKDGKIYPTVRWVNGSRSGGVKLAKPMSADDLRKFGTAMKSRAAKVKEVEGKKAGAHDDVGQASPPEDLGDAPPADADDLPF